MVNVTKMQDKINKLLSVFTNLTHALEQSIEELRGGIASNERQITQLQKDNACYDAKIEEYTVLKDNISGIFKNTSGESV